MRRLSLYRVRIGGVSSVRLATSVGNAFRMAVRKFIALGHIRRQPKSTPDGGWENTSVDLVVG